MTTQRSLRHHLCSGFKQAMVSSGTKNIAACVESLLGDAVSQRASDIHLSPQSDGMLLRMRVDGNLYDAIHLTDGDGVRILRHFKTMANLDTQRQFKPSVARQTATVGDEQLDLRLSVVPTICGDKLTVRLLDRKRLDQRIDELGLSSQHVTVVEDWLSSVSGMCLVTGPTGGGKTTTMYAMLKELAKLERSVTTIEDPVEYQLDGITQIQVDERHELSFAEGIRASMRLDPDYIVLGEIRDDPTAHAAIRATSSGHPVLSTLHSRDAVGAVTTLRNWNLSDYEIASSLQIVIAQRLVRVLCKQCRKHAAPDDADKRWLQSIGLPIPEQLWNAVGCDECQQLGYNGRTGVFEVWSPTEDDYRLILEHADVTTIRKQLAKYGHEPMLVDGLRMTADGVTTINELRMLGSFYVPPQQSLAGERLTESIGWL